MSTHMYHKGTTKYLHIFCLFSSLNREPLYCMMYTRCYMSTYIYKHFKLITQTFGRNSIVELMLQNSCENVFTKERCIWNIVFEIIFVI